MKNTRIDIEAAYTTVAAALTAKNRPTEAAAVAAAAGFDGNDQVNIANLATAAGVSVTFDGNDEVYLAAVTAAVDALPTIVSCVHPLLDAPSPTLVGGAITGQLTLSNGDKTASYTVAGALGAQVQLAAAPAGVMTAASETLTTDAGKKKVEFGVVMPAAANTGSGGDYVLYLSVLSQAFATLATVQINTNNDGTFDIQILREGLVQVLSLTSQASIPASVGMEFNADTSTFRVLFDNVAQTLTGSDAYTPALSFPMVQVVEQAAVDASNAGKVVSATLRTHSADMLNTFAVDAVDTCGTA